MLTLLCDSCLNKGICRVRELKDELYPHTIIEVSNCQRHESGNMATPAAPVAPTTPKKTYTVPVMPRSVSELADISARIKAITKEKAEDRREGLVKCDKCGKFILADDSVTDISTGATLCESCYDS